MTFQALTGDGPVFTLPHEIDYKWLEIALMEVNFVRQSSKSLYAFIYCNDIESTPVGNTLVPLLRVVALHDGERQNHIFQNRYYSKVRLDRFEYFYIYIRDEYGELLDISGLDLTIHLRVSL